MWGTYHWFIEQIYFNAFQEFKKYFFISKLETFKKKAEWYPENQMFLARLNPQWGMNVNVKG